MQIIKRGKIVVDTWRRTCSKCQTVFEYDKKDIKLDPRNEDYVNCPLCEAFITHSEDHREQLLLDRSKDC